MLFNRIFAGLSAQGGEPDEVMIDATHLKAHRTAASVLKGGHFPDVFIALLTSEGRPESLTGRRLEQSPRGTKLHAVCDQFGRPIIMLLTEGQVSDYKGVATTRTSTGTLTRHSGQLKLSGMRLNA